MSETDETTPAAAEAEAFGIDALQKTCFVIMPFGKKKVGRKTVDFDKAYQEVFAPAISAATTPEGDALRPARTDMDGFSGAITQDMYEYIMYSRIAFADISGFNANVMYEIGARHATQKSGTVLFRQPGHDIPFDIGTIKVFEYAMAKPAESREQITSVLTRTLRQNRLDSPVQIALRAQYGGAPVPAAPAPPGTGDEGAPLSAPLAVPSGPTEDDWRREQVDGLMRDAEEAIRVDDKESARIHYWAALRMEPTNIVARMRMGLVLKHLGRTWEALEEFSTLTRLAPDYADAWREKGAIESKLARELTPEAREKNPWIPDGSASLERATRLDPTDFDAWASWGGILSKVHGDLDGAYAKYKKAAEVSDGHPYPLLNAIKSEARQTGRLDLESYQSQLEKAESLRAGQAAATPPRDTPWCFFDLSEIALYRGDEPEFLRRLEQGVAAADGDVGMIESHLNTLKSNLVEPGVEIPGLKPGLELLEAAVKQAGKKKG